MPDEVSKQGLHVQLPRPTCAYCKAPVEIQEEKAACTACMSWSHAECADAHGACPACGAGAPAAPASAPSAGKALEQAKAPLGETPPSEIPPSETPTLEQAQAPRTRPPAPQATTAQLLFLVLVGCAFFGLSVTSLGAVIGGLGRGLGYFGEPGSTGRIVAFAVMGSLISTPLFVLRVAAWLEQRSSPSEGSEP